MYTPNMELRKFVAPEFVFGLEARFLAGRYAKNFGAKKVLLVTGPHILKTGWVDDVTSVLESENISYEIYSNVTPNPKVDEVMEGAEIYQNEGCNAMVAVGGGSPMDYAKGIGIVSSNNKHILDFEGVDMVSKPAPPLICIPTTSGSSADVSQFAIILDQDRMSKIAIISKTLVPDVALIDPVTTTTMDSYLTSCTGVDALVHAFEAYVSNASSPITDLHAINAIHLITSNLIETIDNPDDLGLRGNMMLGSLEAGLAFSNASLGAVHAMSHSLGGFLDLPHGECNAILLDHVVEFNFESEMERYEQIGIAMGLNMEDKSIERKKITIINELGNLKQVLGIKNSLKKIGVRENDIQKLSIRALEDPCIITNPRRPLQKDIEEIFKAAL